jgi:anti-sigma factor RsiW
MSGPARPIAEEELHAYVDNQLDPERLPAIQRYLQEQPEVAQRVAAYSAQREALRTAFAAVAAEPIPPRLDLEGLIQQRLVRRRGVSWALAASVLLAFILGGAGGWLLHSGMVLSTDNIALLTQEAVANHVVYAADRRRPTELGAEQRDDLARWVSNRLNHRVAPPDLAADGYRYMGGRLAATPDGPAGQFMYDDAQGVRLTVFVLPMGTADSAPIQPVNVAQMDGCAWIDKGVGYVVVGKLPAAELKRIAEQVRRQFASFT